MKILIVFLGIGLIAAINPFVGLIVGVLTLIALLCYSGITLFVDLFGIFFSSKQNGIDTEKEICKILEEIAECEDEQHKELLEAKLKYYSLKLKGNN